MGCATKSVFILPDRQIQNYKCAYIGQPKDEYGIRAKIFRELTQMGLLIVEDPQLADLRVVFAYNQKQDVYLMHYLAPPAYYLNLAGYKITFYDTKDDKMIAEITFDGGAFSSLSTPETKLNKGFKMLKSKMKQPGAE